jgi:hypothetical protein
MVEKGTIKVGALFLAEVTPGARQAVLPFIVPSSIQPASAKAPAPPAESAGGRDNWDVQQSRAN